jgi:outer membrane protein
MNENESMRMHREETLALLDKAIPAFATPRRQGSAFKAVTALRYILLVGISGPLTLSGIGVTAQETSNTLTLDQAFAAALKQHPTLLQADAQIGAARSRMGQAHAGMMPSLVLQGTATNGPLGAPAFGAIGNPALYGAPPLSVQGMAGDPIKKQFGGGLNITQTLFDFGRTQHLVAARRGLLFAAEEDAEAQTALVLLEVQQSYLNVLRARQLMRVLEENVRQRETTVKQARLFVEGQLKAGVDLQLALANAAEANVGLIAGQNDLRSAFAALNSAMGATKLTEYTLVPSDAVPTNGTPAALPLPSVEQAITLALAQRPELKSMAFQRQAADQSIRGVRSELLPRFDAIASLGVVNPGRVITNSQNYAVGLAVSIPLYTGGLVEGRVSEEKQKRDITAAQEQQTVETVKLQVTQAWLSLQTQEAQVKAAQEQVTSADASLQLASERYRLQLNTLVELTDAEGLAIRAQAFLVNAQYDQQQARALLDWATGATYRRYSRLN